MIRLDNYNGSITQAIYVKAIKTLGTEPAQYSWYFDSGSDAALGMADYAGANSVVANTGEGSALSTFMVAPSVAIPSGGTNVTVIGFFGVAWGEPVVPPAGMTQRWSSRAIGYGIGIGMGDLTMTPGQSTADQIAAVNYAAANTGAQIVLSSKPSPTLAPASIPTPAVGGTTYYVSTTGSDFNNGTSRRGRLFSMRPTSCNQGTVQ
jgi:hypothetical protein